MVVLFPARCVRCCLQAASALLLLWLLLADPAVLTAQVAEPAILLRAESLTLLPKSKPVLQVRVANRSQLPVRGVLSVRVPPSWQMTSDSEAFDLAVGEEVRLSFPVADGDESKENAYPLELIAEVTGRRIVRQQTIAVASAPYFKPTIDGQLDDWKDAIPVTFVTGGRKTVIATYWNRRQFSLLVSVDEAAQERSDGSEQAAFDAVQLVLAARGTQSSRDPEQPANRFEYLLYADVADQPHCCQLAAPATLLKETGQPRTLEALDLEDAAVAIWRAGQTTYYELSLPLTKLRADIRPSEGREFFLSVLVHDPDGVGLRQWSQAAGLWPQQANRLAWSNWAGAQYKDVVPLDCRAEWGMCSSRY